MQAIKLERDNLDVAQLHRANGDCKGNVIRHSSGKEMSNDFNNNKNSIENNCPICGDRGKFACSACTQIFYCSSEHQKKHWKIHKNLCSPFIVKSQDFETGGFQCVASRNLKPGTILLEELPINYALEFKQNNEMTIDSCNCITCGVQISLKENKILENKCSLCGWPVCGLECEKAPIHKDNECLVFRLRKLVYSTSVTGLEKNAQQGLATFCTYMIRGVGLKKCNKSSFQNFMSLMHFHPVPSSQSEIDKATEKQFKWLQTLCSPLEHSEKDYKRIARIGFINSFSVGKTVSATYLTTSRFNHSCVPNCTREIGPRPDFKIKIRTSLPIQKGEPLTLCYFLGHEKGFRYRQKNILSHWGCGGFICQCPLCSDPTELGSFMSAIRCSSCFNQSGHQKRSNKHKRPQENFRDTPDKNEGYFLPVDSLNMDDEADWKCNKCGDIQPVSNFVFLLEGLYLKLESEINSSRSQKELADYCEDILKTHSGLLLHPNHWILQKAIDIIIDFVDEMESNEITESILKKYIGLSMQLLKIRDVTKPGLSLERATLLRQISGATLAILTRFGTKLTRMESLESIRLCRKFQEEALEFFKGRMDQNDDDLTFQREIQDAQMLATILEIKSLKT